MLRDTVPAVILVGVRERVKLVDDIPEIGRGEVLLTTRHRDITEEESVQERDDQPVHGQYGSVQRTSRRNRSLKDDEEVIGVLKEVVIPRERIMAIDREKVDDAQDVTDLSESAVYKIKASEYVRKADVDEEHKETRLQGLKDQLALSDDPDAEELREEVDELEQRIEELTEFKPGTEIR